MDYCLLFLFSFVNLTIAIECDRNGLDGMCHLGDSQLIIVKKISFLWEIDEPNSRFWPGFLKIFTGKGICYQFNSEIYGFQK